MKKKIFLIAYSTLDKPSNDTSVKIESQSKEKNLMRRLTSLYGHNLTIYNEKQEK